MKILQLIYSLSSGGAERFVVSLSNCLADMGYDVEICMLLDDSDESKVFNKKFMNPNVKFHSMKFKRGFSLHKVRETETYLKSKHPDVVHCHLNVIPYIYGLAIKNKSILFVHTLHSIAPKVSASRYQYALDRFLYKHAYIQPVTISRICQKTYQDFYHLFNAPFVDNGCVPVSESVSIEDVKAEVDMYKHNEHTPVFIHVARFNSAKNQQLLIDSFNNLYTQGIDFTLLIIGDGFQTVAASELKAIACPNIYFIGEKNNVGDYLLCSDAFCLTSKYEGLPISLLEALSAGVTPICTAVGGIPNVIKDGETGYLAPDNTQDAYISALKRFLNKAIDPSLLKSYFLKYFSIQRCTEKYLQIYQMGKS